jgi:hypothetical protein
MERSAKMSSELRIPLAIDLAVLATAMVAYGMLWQKVDTLVQDVASVRAALETERAGGISGRALTAERLARLETEVRMTREDIAELKAMLRKDMVGR